MSQNENKQSAVLFFVIIPNRRDRQSLNPFRGLHYGRVVAGLPLCRGRAPWGLLVAVEQKQNHIQELDRGESFR